MKLKLIWKTTALFLLLVSALLIFSCQSATLNSNSAQAPNPYANQPVGNAQSPTEAYKMLYAAVKSKDTEKIKTMMSKNSHGLAEFAAGQQKKPVAEVFANGFTETTFADALPEIRDERIKDNMGAIEVWNDRKKIWENLPFILEDGSWKFAIGDAFKGSFEFPGKSQSIIEQEAANAKNPNLVPAMPPNSNMNANVKPIIIDTNKAPTTNAAPNNAAPKKP